MVGTKNQLGALDNIIQYPNTSLIVSKLLKIWPEHAAYCEARFRGIDADFEERMDEVSALILKNMDKDHAVYSADYRWMCEEFLREEIHFRRTGSYRLSKFEDALKEVYGLPEYMSRYVRGILISQIIWEPHARAFDFFRITFLDLMPKAARYLEIGPGHGFFLYFAARHPKVATLEAWDVSSSSIAETQSALERLGVEQGVKLVKQDVLEAPSRRDEFDGAVISEVLEHLEHPDLALKSLHASLKPGGRIFINAPLNSPAPDHIYLWTSTDEFLEFVQKQGFEIERAEFFPVTGATLESAVRKQLSISCVVIGRKPSD